MHIKILSQKGLSKKKNETNKQTKRTIPSWDCDPCLRLKILVFAAGHDSKHPLAGFSPDLLTVFSRVLPWDLNILPF